ncbi:DALR anticodon-binding domain-containing protein, partial [Glycocaulis sp.]|uniref:DALR anticodon-binding domain-containing protein n=1 Tax=Glycocaulis sp. TaxID=1969725 RepID=UPI003F6EA8A1
IGSLLRKAQGEGLEPGPVQVSHAAEAALVRRLDGFDAAVQRAEAGRAPHLLCEHAFNLAQAFSAFYTQCPILPEKDEAIRASRLRLARTTLTQLQTVLGLIGLDVPERM